MDPIFGNLTVCFTRRDPSLRWSLLLSAAIASIGLSGCDGLIPRAGEVTQDPRDPVKGLSGSFEFQTWSTQAGAIKSDGTGGACLQVRMRDIPGYGQMQCTGETARSAAIRKDPNSACGPWPRDIAQSSEDAGADTTPKLWLAACELPKDAAPNAVGECWGKPINREPAVQALSDRRSCNRSLDYNDPKIYDPTTGQRKWDADQAISVNREPLYLQNSIYAGLAKPSHWRIIACIREHSGDISPTNVTICDWGPIKTIP